MNRWQTWRTPPSIAGTAADTINDADSSPPVDTYTPPVTDTSMNVGPNDGPIDAPSIPPSQFSSNDPSIETNETSINASTISNTASIISEVASSETNSKPAQSSSAPPAPPTEKEPITTNVGPTTSITNKNTNTSTNGTSITNQSTTLEKEPRVSASTTTSNSTNLDTEEETRPTAPTPSATRTITTPKTNHKPLVSSRYSVCRKSKTPFKDRKPYKGWYIMLEEFKKYFETHKTSNIDPSPEYAKLKGWVKNQRRDYRYLQEGKPNNMYPIKLQKLREVGFDFRTLPEQEDDEADGIYTVPSIPTSTATTSPANIPVVDLTTIPQSNLVQAIPGAPGTQMIQPIYIVSSLPTAQALYIPPSSTEQNKNATEQVKSNKKTVMYLPKGSQAAKAAATLQSSQVDDANKYHMSCPEQLFNQQGRVGIYNADARKDRIEKYHSGRKRRQDIYFDNNLSSSKKLKETASDVPKKASKRKSTDMGASSSADEENDEDMDETATTSGAKKPNITGEGTDAKAASEAEAATSLSELGLASAIATLPSPGTPGYSFISPNQMTWHSTPPQAASTTTPRTTPRKSTGSLYNSKDDLSTLSREELIQRCNRLQSELTKVTDKFKKQKISWEAKNAQKAGYIKTLKKQRDRQNDPLKYSWFGSLSVEELSQIYFAAGLWKDESAGNEEGGDTTANSIIGAAAAAEGSGGDAVAESSGAGAGESGGSDAIANSSGDTTPNSSSGVVAPMPIANLTGKIPTEKRDLVYRMICHPRTKPYAWDNKSLDASDVLSAEQLRIKCQELKLHHGLGAPRLKLVLRILQHEYETIDERFYLLKKMQSKEDQQALSNNENNGKQVFENAKQSEEDQHLLNVNIKSDPQAMDNNGSNGKQVLDSTYDIAEVEAELGSKLDNFLQETLDNVYVSENGEERRSPRNPRLKTFDERIAELLIFKQEHGHVNVKNSHGNPSLAAWCVKMRRHKHNAEVVAREGDADTYPLRRKYTLAPEKIQRLEQIGFDFTYKPLSQKKTFDEYFELLLEFKEKHGHMEVSKYGEDSRLGNWCRDMRVAYKTYKAIEANPDDQVLKERMKTLKRINADHIRRLEEAGFRLQSSDRKVANNFQF